MPLRLVIEMDLYRLPGDPAEQARRILAYWAGWLGKMDLTLPAEHTLRDSNYQPVGTLRLVEANTAESPEGSQ